MEDILNITNFGTIGNPLFRAIDIGNLLGIKNIRDTIYSLDEQYKMKINMKGLECGNYSDTWLITEEGIKHIICKSRKIQSINLAKKLGIKYDIKIITKETQFINQIKIAFSNLDMKEQFQCLNYRIDLYFPIFKLAIEFDENHSYKGSNADIKRQQLCENYLGCKFIRVKETDDIFVVINTIIINIYT